MMDKTSFNFYGCTFNFKGYDMGTLAGIVENLNAALDSVNAIDLKLDDIRALIAELRAGTIITQEEIDALAVKAEELKAATTKVVTEANETV